MEDHVEAIWTIATGKICWNTKIGPWNTNVLLFRYYRDIPKYENNCRHRGLEVWDRNFFFIQKVDTYNPSTWTMQRKKFVITIEPWQTWTLTHKRKFHCCNMKIGSQKGQKNENWVAPLFKSLWYGNKEVNQECGRASVLYQSSVSL